MEHLHHESKIMPVGDHLDMLSRQFLAKTLVPDHALHQVTTRQPGPRSLRHTLSSRHLPAVAPFFRNGSLPGASQHLAINPLPAAFGVLPLPQQLHGGLEQRGSDVSGMRIGPPYYGQPFQMRGKFLGVRSHRSLMQPLARCPLSLTPPFFQPSPFNPCPLFPLAPSSHS